MHKSLSLTVLVLIFAVYPFCPIARAEAPPTTNPLKATADASSIFNSGFPAKFATDGDLNTRWCSSEPYGKREWLLVDLGKTQPIGRVEILWEVYALGYQISVSNDAEDWHAVFKSGAGDGGRDVINGLNATGRYLRLDCLDCGTEHGFSIWEFEVFTEATTQPDALKDVVPVDFNYIPPDEIARRVELSIDKKYLNLPLRNGIPRRNMTIKIVDAYLAAFQKTPLVMLIGGGDMLRYVVENGAGWRADCLGDMGGFSKNWCHMRMAYPRLLPEADAVGAWRSAPVAWETCWDMRKWGSCFGRD